MIPPSPLPLPERGTLTTCGHERDSVLELLLRRISHPHEAATDGRRLALVVEGGGMRGVVSAGVLSALSIAGAGTAFWKAYASSAGAINTTHFLSGKGVPRANTYHRFLASRRFFKPLRFHRMVDTGYVIDEVLKRDNPLDVAAFLASQTPLVVPLFHYDRAETVYRTLVGPADFVFEQLRAATAIPVVSGKLPTLAGERVCDGGLECPVPIAPAIADGATDILVILSHDPWQVPDPLSHFQRLLYRLFFARGREDLLQVLESRAAEVSRQSRICRGDTPDAGGPRILCFHPVPPVVGALCTDRLTLRDALIGYARETLALLGRAALASNIDDLAAEGNPWGV